MNEVIVISGASAGIGKALALALAAAGEQVYAIARRIEPLQEMQQLYPNQIKIIAADVSTEEGRLHIKNTLPEGTKIKALVHNAAMMSPTGFLENIDVKEWRNQIAVNLEAPLFLTTTLLPYLEGGRILNVTIYSSFKVTPGLGAYGISKAALNTLTEYFKVELQAHRIAVGSVLPGGVDTDGQKQQAPIETPAMLRTKRLREEGKLLQPEVAARFLKWLLLETKADEFSEKVWDIYDQSHHPYWAAGLSIVKPV